MLHNDRLSLGDSKLRLSETSGDRRISKPKSSGPNKKPLAGRNSARPGRSRHYSLGNSARRLIIQSRKFSSR